MVWLFVLPAAAFFLVIGVVGLFQPEQVGGIFGIDIVGADARNEVRATYGGFGIACAVFVVVAARSDGGSWGLAALGVIVAGMAGGRLLSLFLDRVDAPYPGWAFFGVDVGLGGLLFAGAAVHS